MLRFFLEVLDRYGLDALQLGVICYFGWRIISNHLKHITNKLNELCGRVKNLETDSTALKERISKIEGKLS